VVAVFTQPTDLPDSLVVDAVQSVWSLSIDSVSYAAVGYGSHHWQAEGDGRRWFVTVDDLVARARDLDAGLHAAPLLTAALMTARMLFEAGMTFVVAPVPATSGDVLVPIGDRYRAAIYPWVDGEKFGWGEFATAAERLAVLDRLVSLHQASPDARRFAHAEDFRIPARGRMAVLVDQSAGWDRGPFGMPARRLLDEHGRFLSEQFRLYDGLAAQVGNRPDRMVLTHGEPHRANTIATRAE
jgi:spectinomycin phosphotransferase/16S rRNA (guanine(1405)-N(7))-methyltransferase